MRHGRDALTEGLWVVEMPAGQGRSSARMTVVDDCQETKVTAPSERVRDVIPSRGDAIGLNLVGLLVSAGGLAAYGAVALLRYGDGSFQIDGWGLLAMLLGVVALVVAHEGLHGVAMVPFGARPSFGVGVAGGVLPYAYTTASGHRFDRVAYVVVALGPSVVLTPVAAALVLGAPGGGWLVVPAAVHLGGCVGDWWLVRLALRQPPGSRFEDLKEGLRVHLP